MLNGVYQTDYDTEVQFIPLDYYNEPHLQVLIDGSGAAMLSIDHAELLRDYLEEWLVAATKQRNEGVPVNPPFDDDGDIPF